MGMDAPDAPEWASRYQGHDARISHVFDRDYEIEHLPDGQQCAVVGGGITSVQVARALVETRRRRVLYMTRRPLDELRAGSKSDDWYDEKRRQHLCDHDYPACSRAHLSGPSIRSPEHHENDKGG